MEPARPDTTNLPIRILTRVLEMMLIIAMGALVIDVLWGVASRHLLSSQTSWTEELARYLLIWVGLLGASLAFEKRAHLGVDYFVGKFHPGGRLILTLATLLIVLAFAVGVLIIGGWELVSRTLALKQNTPALGIPKGWVYAVVPISGVFTVLFTLGHMVEAIKHKDTQPQTNEETES